MKCERIFITTLGMDKTGIVSGVSSVLAENNVNIEDISQTILQGYFAMIMVVDIANSKLSLKDLKKQLSNKANEIGVKILVQHEDIFRSMHRI